MTQQVEDQMTGQKQINISFQRIKLVKYFFGLAFLVVSLRLAYWQIWQHNYLSSVADNQYETKQRLQSKRGLITDRQGRIMVGNQEAYTLFAQPHILRDHPQDIAEQLLPIMISTDEATPLEATDEAWLEENKDRWFNQLQSRLADQSKKWVALAHNLDRQQKELISKLNIWGLGFDTYFQRSYPDASSSAQLVGFVGKTDTGQDQGYFGVEGFYDLELKGREGIVSAQKTALGLPLLLGKRQELKDDQGSTLQLTVDKALQHQIEQKLQIALELYGAQAGEVVVMDPQSGAILAMASYPNYDPSSFNDFPATYYRNPVISDLYEPGSTLKILTVAAGIEDGKITPDTECDRCSGPRVINGFPIRTWNEVYNPNISMRDALAKSDNTAMVFVQERIGKTKFIEWLKKFQLNRPTGIDLQGEAQPPSWDSKIWSDIDVATSAFGQGLATTSLHVVQVVSAVANGGQLVQPYVVANVQRGEENNPTQTKILDRVISEKTAEQVTEMMVYTAMHGDAQWALPSGVKIAGKTGTSQIAGEGGYLEDKTITSFVGFAPADDPQFVMLVKLREPTSSPWGSETAAPLWFDIMPLLLNRGEV